MPGAAMCRSEIWAIRMGDAGMAYLPCSSREFYEETMTRRIG
jgi:hypothetical protein